MKNKINVRLVGIAIIAVLGTVIGITIIYYNLFQRQIKTDLSVSAKLLKDTHYFESVGIDIGEISLSTGIDDLRVTWVAEDGTVLYDNDTSAELMQNHNDRPEIQDAFNYGVGEAVRKSDTMNKNTFYNALLLDNGTVLRVATEFVGGIYVIGTDHCTYYIVHYFCLRSDFTYADKAAHQTY